MNLQLKDARIGIRSAREIAVFRSNLAHLLPMVESDRIKSLSLRPASSVAEVTKLVSQLIATAGTSVAAPTIFALGADGEARKKIADRWGKRFASKSSPALLRALTATTREGFALAPSAEPGLVLEFSEPLHVAQSDKRAEHLLDRTERFAAYRDAFYRIASPVRMAIERSAGAAAVQVCWLNSTMRVAGQLSAVAGVAEADDIKIFDVARTLRREMNVAGVTVRIPDARASLGVTGRGIRVAVIDGEVDLEHPALRGRVSIHENFTSEPLGKPDPHGTAVAGIIAGSDGVFGGVAPDALIINYKVFATGSTAGDEFQGMLAIEKALKDGCVIANCSWGTGLATDGTSREAKAFNKAWEAGLILIKSAGNNGPDGNTITSPGDADGVVVVGATDRQGTAVQNYSSRGPTLNGKRPHLVAPGGTSFSYMETCLAGGGGGFGPVDYGTSFAAPVVSGAAALLREKFPSETPDEIRQRLLRICRPLAAGDQNVNGEGLIDLSML